MKPNEAVLIPDDRTRLATFCEVCDKIAGCRFVRDFHKQSHLICIGTLPDGTVKDEYPRYDDDDFRAFMTHYRKLRLEQEPTNLFRVMNLLAREGDQSDRAELAHYKAEIKEEGRCWWGMVPRGEKGDDESLTLEELEKLILYGDVIHVEQDKKEKLALLAGRLGLMKYVAFSNYIRFVSTVVNCAHKTAELIRRRGYLDLPGPPSHP